LEEKGAEVEIVEYLKDPPSEDELKVILKKIGKKPLEIIRKGEVIFKEHYKGKEFSDNEWIRILAQNPILIERPIVIGDSRGVIGRPPENVLDLL